MQNNFIFHQSLSSSSDTHSSLLPQNFTHSKSPNYQLNQIMQDIQLINTDQLYPHPNTTTGAGGSVILDRRLRQTHLQNQALKCPRCDSLNTKFCYYNNYNLSQPRHFCKSCRRYWTKGGVLRNVPVGGGCRKSSKRSSAAAKSSKCLNEVRSKLKSDNSNSSSESSSLVASSNAAVVGGDTAAITALPTSSVATPPCTDAVSNSFGTMFGFGDAKYLFPQIRNPNFGSELLMAAECGGVDGGGDGGGGFADIRNFSNETATRNFSTASYDAVSPYEQWQLSTDEVAAGGSYVDPTVRIDPHQSSNLGSEPLSWLQEQNQRQMFGSTSAVDQGGYWSQQQWSNTDNAHLYLP